MADVKKAMFTGFGTENVQGLFNGLLWGPDGWIYGVTSSNGGEIRNLSRPGVKPVQVRGRDFRFQPDGSAFEAVSEGGQFGHSFDDWGHRFTCSNSNHIRQIVIPAHDLERNPALTPPSVVMDIPAEGPAAPVFRREKRCQDPKNDFLASMCPKWVPDTLSALRNGFPTPYPPFILKWAGASGAAPAWTGVTAFMVTKKAERRISARPGRTPGKDYD